MLFLGGAPLRGAAVGRRLFLGELPLRGAARVKEGEGSFWGSCRCAGLQGGTCFWGAAAARGCSIEGGRSLFLGELPLRGAARLKEGEGSFWGRGSRCAGLQGGTCFVWGAAAARGCSIEGGRSLFLGELPLRGAAQLREGEGSFWGSCRCAGLLD